MREFEEFEGLGSQVIDETIVIEEEDDGQFQPANASLLTSNDIYYELDKRNLKTTGFPDTDREILQKAFDEEFKNDLENMRARRREKQRKAAQQLGLQRRRLLMEKTLQEEQDELSKNHQIALMIDFIKDNATKSALRLELNSILARSLAKAMWVNDSITCLDLSSNDLNDHAGSYLARILKRNSTIKKMELDNNNLGPKSCHAFGESLLTNTSLQYLSLDSNPIMANHDLSGLRNLADALRTNNTLTSLNLWRAGINVIGGDVLASAIEDNSTLLLFDIGHNNIDIGDVKRIIDKLDSNLAAFEKTERARRKEDAAEKKRNQTEAEKKESERKQKELAEWLQTRRDQRANDRRTREEERIIRLQEEAEERRRLLEARKEEERKAAEEAAAKKAKKKDKKGKK